MVKSFDVVYDDFSGGHFVGQVSTKQPMNTWVGYNVGVDPLDGTLLPLEDPFTVTNNFAAGGTVANASRPIWIQGLSAADLIVYGTNTHINKFTPTVSPPAALTSTATGTAVLANSQPCVFNLEVLWPPDTGSVIVRYNPVTNAVNTTATPAQLERLIAWGDFVFGVTFVNGNRIYFSNPGISTTWTSTDFVDIGTPPTRVIGWCVHQGSLWVSTNDGWYVLTGIPNSTLSLRQVTTMDQTPDPVSIDTSIVSVGSDMSPLSVDVSTLYANGAIVRELAGNRTRGLNYAASPDGRPPYPMYEMAAVGDHVIASSRDNYGTATDEGGATVVIGATLWILDTRTGVWTRRQLPTLTPKRLGVGPYSSTVLFFLTGSPNVENCYMARLSPSDMIANQGGTIPTATVELAEYYHRTQFKVKEILCQVDYGIWPGGSTYDRSIACAVRASGTPIDAEQDLSLARSVSSTLTHVLPAVAQTGANYTRRRSWVRFNPTDASDSFDMAPIITLSGVRLRKVVVRCEEVG